MAAYLVCWMAVARVVKTVAMMVAMMAVPSEHPLVEMLAAETVEKKAGHLVD